VAAPDALVSPIAHGTALIVAAAVGGAINAVAGGGSLISFPTLVWLGVPSVTANATNTVALWPGSLGSVVGYRRELAGLDRRLYVLVVPSLAGGIVGALLLARTPALLFDRLVPALVFFATCLFALQEPMQRWLGQHPQVRGLGGLTAGAAFQLLVGVYGGYFGAGIGILMLAALGLMGEEDIHQMNGFKNLLAVFVNGIAAVYFIVQGMVSWPNALLMVVGAMAGGLGGAHLARRLGRQVVRRLVVAIGLAMSLALLTRL
jgi:uncharacterized protein